MMICDYQQVIYDRKHNMDIERVLEQLKPTTLWIDIQDCYMEMEVVRRMLMSIDKNILLELTLCWNKINDEGVQLISKFLKNGHITHITLSGNRITSDGAEYISEILNVKNQIKEIGLNFCPIGDKGVKSLFKQLKYNRTLETLNLYHSNITDEGAQIIIETLNTNRVLTNIDLSSNRISPSLLSIINMKLNKNLLYEKFGNYCLHTWTYFIKRLYRIDLSKNIYKRELRRVILTITINTLDLKQKYKDDLLHLVQH